PDKYCYKLTYNHFGAPATAKVNFDGNESSARVEFGDNTIDVFTDKVTAPRKALASVEVNGKTTSIEVELVPAHDWHVNFVQHTHTDIGYTRAQTDILTEHVRYIDYALDYCDATDDYPDEAKFRWTCENTWAVETFLKSRPQSQIDRLVRRVKEGRIELTAMMFNFDGLTDERSLAASMNGLKTLKDKGFTGIEVATQNDVDGVGWALTEMWPDMGIKYLTMGVNTHKALPPFYKTTYFWWESPSGKRTMAYYGPHYMQGNWVKCNSLDFNEFETTLLSHLGDMSNDRESFDILIYEFSGIVTDNSAPTMYACDNIRRWNEKYASPKVKLALLREGLKDVEEKYGDGLMTIRAAWPDWWTDGFASGARETYAVRTSHGEMNSTLTGLSLASLNGEQLPKDLDRTVHEVNEAILFYDEHTYGAHCSISSPFNRETMDQRAVKSSYAWEAFRRNRMLREIGIGYLNGLVSKSDVPSIVVYNPLSWNHGGYVDIYIDNAVMTEKDNARIVDAEGNEVFAQRVRGSNDGGYWQMWVGDVPALGFRQYFVMKDASKKAEGSFDGNTVENKWYKLVFDMERGAIASVYDKELGCELTDSEAPYKLGELISEQLEYRSLDQHRIGNYTRETPTGIHFTGYTPGKVWDSYNFAGNSRAGMRQKDNFKVEYRVYRNTKR
ncbi:MAG: glycosyl hydrolase family 38, partial [Bacteroidales bacterium]|nr:glycosyl hydrolase family 38 [Bacteroidales bacterium]